jgi:prephenate dehydratase
MPTVAFLGPRGTFSEEALLARPELARSQHLPVRSIPEVFAAVDRGDAEIGIVPIENAIEGAVNVTLDTLGFESGLLIQDEVVVNVAMHLCARPGVELGAVKTVASIPIAAAQCREWLAQKLPDAQLAASNSTAEAAQTVARSKSKTQAAITNRLAAEIYGLDVLASDIEDHPENQTRFVVLGRGVPAPTGHDRTSIVVFQSQDRPGSLLDILAEFAARAVNLTKLESRPLKRGLGHYCFFMDCEGHVAEGPVGDVLLSLQAKHSVKFLGSYPVAGGSEGEAKRKAAGKAWKAANAWLDAVRSQVRETGGR